MYNEFFGRTLSREKKKTWMVSTLWMFCILCVRYDVDVQYASSVTCTTIILPFWCFELFIDWLEIYGICSSYCHIKYDSAAYPCVFAVLLLKLAGVSWAIWTRFIGSVRMKGRNKRGTSSKRPSKHAWDAYLEICVRLFMFISRFYVFPSLSLSLPPSVCLVSYVRQKLDKMYSKIRLTSVSL